MKTIPLTQGQVALVDDEDYEALSVFRWYAAWDSSISSFYAQREQSGKTVKMHRLIMGNPKGLKIDHFNHNTLDNQKHNLRACTNSQNGSNRKGPNKGNSSGIRGVCWKSDRNKWNAQIRVNQITISLGYFEDKRFAARVYAEANKKYFGDFGGVVR